MFAVATTPCELRRFWLLLLIPVSSAVGWMIIFSQTGDHGLQLRPNRRLRGPKINSVCGSNQVIVWGTETTERERERAGRRQHLGVGVVTNEVQVSLTRFRCLRPLWHHDELVIRAVCFSWDLLKLVETSFMCQWFTDTWRLRLIAFDSRV